MVKAEFTTLTITLAQPAGRDQSHFLPAGRDGRIIGGVPTMWITTLVQQPGRNQR